MPDYKNVYIGKNTPITVENINQLAQNDQYNYDLLSVAPRGVLAWKNRTSNFTSNDAAASSTSKLSLTYSCEANRLLRVGFWCGKVASNALPTTMTMGLYIDKTHVGGMVFTMLLGSATFEGKYLEVWVNNPFVNGSHTLDLIVTNEAGATYTFYGSATTPMYMWVEDCGSI